MRSFYSDFADYYRAVFPVDEAAYALLVETLGRPPASVLDIGCGTGDYCGRLARDGFSALGVDSDEEMVRAAAETFPDAEFRVLDARHVASLERVFDAAFSIGNTLAHVSRNELPSVLSAARGVLDAGSPWVAQTVNWDRLLGLSSYRFPDVELEGGAVRFERRYPRISTDRVRFETRLSRGSDTLFEGGVWLHPVASSDFVALSEACGFELERHTGSFDGSRFDAASSASSVFVFRATGRDARGEVGK